MFTEDKMKNIERHLSNVANEAIDDFVELRKYIKQLETENEKLRDIKADYEELLLKTLETNEDNIAGHACACNGNCRNGK